jgi:hypothetical protein
MNYPIAIVIAAALIAGAIFFSNQNGLNAADELIEELTRLQQLMEAGGVAGNGEWAGIGADSQGKAWVINTSTGKMKTCWYGKSDGNWTVLCGWED